MPATVAVYSVQVSLAAASGGASAHTSDGLCIESELHRINSGERSHTLTWYRNREMGVLGSKARWSWRSVPSGSASANSVNPHASARPMVPSWSPRQCDKAKAIRPSFALVTELHTRPHSGVHARRAWGHLQARRNGRLFRASLGSGRSTRNRGARIFRRPRRRRGWHDGSMPFRSLRQDALLSYGHRLAGCRPWQ